MRKIATRLPFGGLKVSKPVNTAYPYVTGIEQVGQTLTAGNGSWSGNPTSFTYTYQWFNSSTGSIHGQTSSTYVAKVGDLGCYVTVKVVATNAAGSNTSSSWNMSQISAAGAPVPIISVAPAISSAAQFVGQALTVSNGTWSNSPTSYTYQWFASGTAITGATTNSYTPVAANLGMLLTVNVNAINGAGTSVTAVTVPPTQPVMGPILVNTALPTITGTAQVGQTLTASTGTWTNSPTSYAYQWNYDGSQIGGATNSTYVFQTSDLSGYITVTVTAMNSVGVSAPATSLAFGLNISKPVNTAYPYVTGIEQVGQTLMAGNGSWSGNPTSFTYTYQWFNSSTGSIAGQTSSTYVAKVGDLGCYVTVKVTATNAAGSNTSSSWHMSQISAAGATVPIIGVAPAISSAAQYVGQALTVSNGTWANSPTSYTYQWFASGTAITGATTNSYTPVAANLGMLLTVNVNAINGAGTSVTAVTVPPTQAVMGAILVNTALPTITGTAQVGQTLTASTGTWTNSPTSYAYQWNYDGSPIGGATNSTYVFQTSDLSGYITVTVTAMNSVGVSAPATSLAFGLNISEPVNTAYPYVTGIEQVGQTLTAGNGSWSGNPTSYTYQWFNSSTGSIAGQTSSTYVAEVGDLGCYVTVEVTATNAAGSNTSSSWNMSQISAAGATVPIISVAPAISSAAQYVGQALTVSNGTWSNSPTSYTYQWFASGTAITGATTNSYTPVAANLGMLLTVNVNAINGAGTSVTAVTVPPTQPVMGPILVNTALPTITGTAQVGQTLTASTGTWTNSPTSYAYQWNYDGSPIGGATNSTYVFQTSDLSGYITVTVTAMNSVGVSAPATSLAFGLNISEPVNTAYPYVTGIEQVGQTLTAGNGSWSGNPTSFTYTYQWFNSSTGSIAGQTSSTYVAEVGDLGCYVTVEVTATNAAGSNTSSSWNMSQISAAGATVPIISVAPAISSAAQYVGQALTVSNGTWSNSPTSYTYQWFASGTAITGATTNSYTPVAANLGMLLTVNVNAINGAGTSVTAVTVPPTQPVMGAILLNTALPTITGTAQVGQTLTASTGTWTNSPTSYAYQWNNEGSPISGATNSTYTLQTSDLGALITVAVTPMNSAGAGAPAYSAVAGPVISTTVFYVADAGSDANTGTSPSAPWQTLAKVNGFAFPAGASVLFNRGDTFIGQLAPTASGSAGSPIVFDAYGTGADPTIQGSVLAGNTNQWTSIGTNIWSSNQSFPPASNQNVTITTASPTVITWSGVVPTNGQGVVFYTTGALPSGITPGVGYFVVGVSGSSSNIAATPSGTPINTSGSQSGTQSAGTNGFPFNQANDIGNLIWSVSGALTVGTTLPTLWTNQTDAGLITNAVQGQWYFSIVDWKVHVYSVGNPATMMPGLQLAIDQAGAYLNLNSYINIQNFNIQFCADSGVVFNQTTNTILRDCTVQWVGGGNQNGSNIRYGDGFDVIQSGNNIVVERCIFNQCYATGPSIQPFSASMSVSNVTFRNNVILNTPQAGLMIETAGATLTNIFFYNNTIFNPGGWSNGQIWGNNFVLEGPLQYGLFHDDNGVNTINNYQNLNNVYAGLGDSCSIRGPQVFTDWQGSGNMLLDYNLWSRADGTVPLYCASSSGGTENLSVWAAGDTPPQEVHGQIGVSPGFVAPGHLSPGAGSNMLNAGTNLYGVGVVWDYNHLPRPSSGPFTVGAIQYVGGFL